VSRNSAPPPLYPTRRSLGSANGANAIRPLRHPPPPPRKPAPRMPLPSTRSDSSSSPKQNPILSTTTLDDRRRADRAAQAQRIVASLQAERSSSVTPIPDKQGYYALLKIIPDTSFLLETRATIIDARIKNSFTKLATLYHPDQLDGEAKKQGEEKFKEITAARDVISKGARYCFLISLDRADDRSQSRAGNSIIEGRKPSAAPQCTSRARTDN
jgi:hypothetical protein